MDRRLTAAKQRCENPNAPEYSQYGGRGIRFDFPSVTEAGLYLLKEYGLPDRKMELDRIDNNGNYAPGNIRFVTHTENNRNKQSTVLNQFEQKYLPYSYPVVIRKLSAGLSRERIIRDAQQAVKDRRRNWHMIDARLDFMTYSMPDLITVLPYRVS